MWARAGAGAQALPSRDVLLRLAETKAIAPLAEEVQQQLDEIVATIWAARNIKGTDMRSI